MSEQSVFQNINEPASENKPVPHFGDSDFENSNINIPANNSNNNPEQSGAEDARTVNHAVSGEIEDEVIQFEGPSSINDMESDDTVIAILFEGSAKPRRIKLSELKEAVSYDRNFVWVDLSGYTEPTLRRVATILDLNPLALRATLAAWQRPRYDNFRKHFFLTATVAHLNSDAHHVFASELDLFVGPNYLVSTHKSDLPFANRIAERSRHSPELLELDSAFMLYIILDELLEYYEELCDHVEDENEQMEQRALKDTSDHFLEDLLKHKRYIFALNRLADQHRKVFAALARPDSPLSQNDEVRDYFNDLEEHFQRLLDTLQPAKEAVNGAFEIYVSHVSHRTNQVIKTLTIISTILLPTSVIISLFGTNLVGLSQYGILDFVLMVAVILVTNAVILLVFQKRGWL